jgi:N6-adenosine-specific RNA methylase IME4
VKAYKHHPAAKLFPMMKGAELREFERDIAESKLREPIVLFDDMILDGRNRDAVCRKLKIEPKYVTWTGRGAGGPVAYVISKNMHRRHLNESQRALVAARALPLLEKEARGRKGNRAPGPGSGRARDIAAAPAGVSGRTVARAKALIGSAPKAELDAIAAGDKTLKQVERELKRAGQDKKVAAYVPPDDVFQMHTVDFSWPYRDTREGNDNQRGLPYPPQTLEEILAYIRGPLAAGCDPKGCVVGNWITGPISIDLTIAPVVQAEFETLGFKMVHERIWKKTRVSGADFIGQGAGIRWNAEKLQLYVRGDVAMAETGGENPAPLQHTVFEAPVGEHSEKPQKAYDELELLFPLLTKRLEHHARSTRAGWVATGAELEQPKKKKQRKLEVVDVTEAA